MNLRDLEYIIAIADKRNFNKAAEACFVTQPALSMQVKKLENELGVKLFERFQKNILITAAGGAFGKMLAAAGIQDTIQGALGEGGSRSLRLYYSL